MNNRIKINKDFYTVSRIGIIPYCKISNTEYRILLNHRDDEYQDFFTFVKRTDNYESLLQHQIKKIKIVSDLVVGEPIKKIINSSQKTVYLEWLIEVGVTESNKSDWFKVIYVNDSFEIEKKELPLNCALDSIKKSVVKKLGKC